MSNVTRTRIETVQKILRASEEITAWYRDEFNIKAEDLTIQNVREYGGDGLGEAADMILADGHRAGIITSDEMDAAA